MPTSLTRARSGGFAPDAASSPIATLIRVAGDRHRLLLVFAGEQLVLSLPVGHEAAVLDRLLADVTAARAALGDTR